MSRPAYREKPAFLYDVSMGIYVYERRALDFLPDSGPCQFPDLVHRLLAAGEPVATFHSEADAFDVGTFTELQRASEALTERPEDFDAAGLGRSTFRSKLALPSGRSGSLGFR